MLRADVSIARSKSASTLEDAIQVGMEIGYPLIIRVAYTLGGKGSGVAQNESELKDIVSRALGQSMISQVLIEEYLGHWKEVEYEVMRDYDDNCIIVCQRHH